MVTDLPNNAEACVSTLISAGVDHFFLVVGGNAMFLNEAIRVSNVKFTIFHHEQSAAMAAEAYARLNSKVAACISTSGPGATNLITGVAGAFLDSAAVVFVSGQAKSNELGTADMEPGVRQFGTFELPIKKIVSPIVKESVLFHQNEDIVFETQRLVQVAYSGRPGPVYLEFPLDLQSQEYLKPSQAGTSLNLTKTTSHNLELSDVNKSKIAELLQDLSNSTRPVIVAGHGIRSSNSVEMFMQLVDELCIPVITTQLAKDLISYSNPLFIGHPGIRGDRAGNHCLQESDLIITIGTSLQQQSIGYDSSKFAPKAKKYVLDYDKSVSSKKLNFGNTTYIEEDLSVFILYLLRRISETSSSFSKHKSWLHLNEARKLALSVHLEPHEQSMAEINLYNFVNALSRESKAGDVFVSDAGLCYYVMGQALLLKENQRYIVSGGLGAMGYAIPASIGVGVTKNTRVYCVTGDGSAQFNIQELATLSEQQSNVTIFIINNNGYASIRNTQKAFFNGNLIGSSEKSGILMPSWELLANAYEIPFLRVATYENLEEEMQKIVQQQGPLLVEVLCQENQVLMPSIQSKKNSAGVLVSDDLSEMWPNGVLQRNIDSFN